MQKAMQPEILLIPMNNWKVATTNARDMNNPENQQDIIRWHQNNQHTISFITEIRLKSPTAQFLKSII